MADEISLRGIRVFAHHGVLPAEVQEGQIFLVDLTVRLWSIDNAVHTDDLAHTLDYVTLAKRVHDLVAGERWNLIERVAQRVAELVLEDPQVVDVDVTVHKPQAPLEVTVDDVSVTLHRSR